MDILHEGTKLARVVTEKTVEKLKGGLGLLFYSQ